MGKFGFLLIIPFILVSCQRDYNTPDHFYKFFPSKSEVIISVNELNDFIQSSEHTILNGIYNRSLKAPASILKNFNTRERVYIVFFGNQNANYLVLTKNTPNVFAIDSIPNYISENISEIDITKTQIDSAIVYHKTYDNVFALSNNLEELKKLKPTNQDDELSKLIETTDKKSIVSLIFKANRKDYSNLLFSEMLKDSANNYISLDLSLSEKNLHFNGVAISNDSISRLIDCFKNTTPQEINTLHIAPASTKSLMAFAYDDFAVFHTNLNHLNGKVKDSTKTFLNFTNEMALVDNSLILHSLDANLVVESIEEKSIAKTFRDIEIYEFGTPDFFKLKLHPIINYDSANYFSKYDDFIVFSNSIELIESILSDVLNNNTIANSEAFKNISKNLTDESSIFIYKNNEALSEHLNLNIKNYHANVVQYSYEDNYAHVNGIIEEFRKKAASNSVTESFTTSIGKQIISPPQTVKNHVNNTHDIAVQDIDNVLYLISNSGNILWKKQLQGKILGEIEQIDMYKNGRLQLAFVTPNRLYVLDRNGNEVSPFPFKFNDEVTQPLSVFDYDKNRNYRLLVTQGKNLLMYDAKGKMVKGFSYKSNNKVITSQPMHFRIGTKDYIVFSTEDQLKVLNRQGNVRINVTDKIRFSDNKIYLYQNKFTASNTLGQLVQMDSKGKINRKDLNLTDKHNIATTSKTLVSMYENKLFIKSRRVDLDYGVYTAPRIYYLNDKIYVTLTDLQSKKVYLYDSQAKPIPNFPVFGTSAAELQKLDKDKDLELITQADDKTIIVYKLH
ncbi:ribonuclease HII [Winogradskyella aquimaris]|uniref:ribonuclease HII n=1 Tax=Winogradskyella aquimaris TaxID=864074 RepID=UPI002A74F5A0|nr:ribonuclease HII [Winogradskyella aquimaris]